MHINIIPRWDFENDAGERLHESLLPLLYQINKQGKLTAAAKDCDLSYRHAWNILEKSEAFFGKALVVKEKGRGAQLTQLGQKLLWSNQRIDARLHPEMESFATELNVELQSLLSNHAPVVRIYASHGYAVALMTQYVRDYQVEIHYHAPQHALIALNEGRCRIAGFHQPIGLEVDVQKRRYQELLDPKRFGIIRFIRRQQGLMYKEENKKLSILAKLQQQDKNNDNEMPDATPVKPSEFNSIQDLKQGGYRFINRQQGSGTRELFEQLLFNEGISPRDIPGIENQELTHSAVAAYIASGMADVGFGVEAAAKRFGLAFTPIIEEYYLWAYPLEAEQDEDIQAFIATLSNPEYQAQINQLHGYQCEQSGTTSSTNWLFKDS